VAVCAVIAAPALAAPVAAQALPPTLKLLLPATEQVGQPIAVTATGNADGTLRLFLFADEQRRPCAASPSAEQHGSWELTPYGGEQLPAGEFTLTYSYTPQVQIAELCAYLDDTASGVPAVTARTPEPVREYQEGATEAPPLETRSGELPGAIKPQPVNEQLMKEYWARVEREEREHERVRTIVPPCVVPRLRGHTLTGARRALQAAGCVLGHIRRKGARGRLVVLAQGVPAGRVLQGGASVAVVLGSRRH
jgi:hypothetical protein